VAEAPDYQVSESEDAVRRMCARLTDDGLPIGIDIETGYAGPFQEDAQLRPEVGFVASIQLTNSNRWARLLPLKFDSGGNLDNYEVAEALWPVTQTGLLTAWNASFESRWLSRWFKQHLSDHPEFGQQVRDAHYGNPEFCGYFPWRSDPMLEAHAEGKSRSLKLKDNTRATSGYDMMEIAELFAICGGGKALTKKEMSGIRFNTLDLAGEHRGTIIKYGCDDSVLELWHHHRRYPSVRDNLIYQMEMAILPIVCQMMDEGILLDWPGMREAAVRAGLFQEQMLTEIQEDLTGMLVAKGIDEPCRINLNSSQQLGRVLYEQLGMPVHRHTPRKRNAKGEMTGGTPSTEAKTALKPLTVTYPVVQRVIDYKSLGKLKGTYLEKYELSFSYCPCGRTHPNWMQAGVPAGRFACSQWPVQQSPKKYYYALRRSPAEFRHNFRDNVKAPEGWYILGYDYAQIERRVFAGEAQDPALLEAFRSGVDIHKATAAGLFKIPIEAVTSEQRSVGKTTGFGMDYGLAEDGLADRLGISVEAARGLRDAYFAAYPMLRPCTERMVAFAKQHGYALTGGFKRRVPVWEFESSDRRIYSEGERLAGNAPIQGGAADYMKMSMIRADRIIRDAGLGDKVRLIMNMHDALEWYVHKSVKPLDLIRILQPAVVWTAPFIAHWPPMVAEWHLGLRWGSVREVKLELDDAGLPVSLSVQKDKPPAVQAEGSGDEEDGFASEVTPAVAAVAASAGTAGSAAGSPGMGAAAGGPILVAVEEMPDVQAVHDLIVMLRQRPGADTVVLRTPQGELEIARGCSLQVFQHPEVSLMLGVAARLSVATAQPV
jgi:DNA polymerase I-like protein with 3'-5' exonuclease and polymerase domains